MGGTGRDHPAGPTANEILPVVTDQATAWLHSYEPGKLCAGQC